MSYVNYLRWGGSVGNHVSGEKPEIPQKTSYAYIVTRNRIIKTNGSWWLNIGSKITEGFLKSDRSLKKNQSAKGLVVCPEKTGRWYGYKYIQADWYHYYISENNPVLNKALRNPLLYQVLHILGHDLRANISKDLLCRVKVEIVCPYNTISRDTRRKWKR